MDAKAFYFLTNNRFSSNDKDSKLLYTEIKSSVVYFELAKVTSKFSLYMHRLTIAP